MNKKLYNALMMIVVFASVLSARAEDAGWEVAISPYLWGVGIGGNVGVGEVRTEVDVPVSRILETLELGAMLGVEVRKGRWGLLADGVYMKLSDDTETPGPFFNTIDTTLENGTADLGLAYRLLDGKSGWLDLIVGARYVYVSVDLEMNPDYEAVNQISSDVMDQVVSTVRGQVKGTIDNKSGPLADELAGVKGDLGQAAYSKIQSGVQIRLDEAAARVDQKIDEIMEKVAAIPPRKLEDLKERIQGKLEGITDAQRDAFAEAVKAKLNARGESIKGDAAAIKSEIHAAAQETAKAIRDQASAKVQKALDAAERELAAAIDEGMKQAADADLEESRAWVDPYVGVRGRLNLTEKLYLGGRGDIGGFGVGSDLMLQLFGGVGYCVTPNIELEGGWRYMSVDYDKDNFLYDVDYSGFVLGARFRF